MGAYYLDFNTAILAALDSDVNGGGVGSHQYRWVFDDSTSPAAVVYYIRSDAYSSLADPSAFSTNLQYQVQQQSNLAPFFASFLVTFRMSGPWDVDVLNGLFDDIVTSMAVFLGISSSAVDFSLSAFDDVVQMEWLIQGDQAVVDQVSSQSFQTEYTSFLTLNYPEIASAISTPVTYTVTYGMSGFYDFASLSTMETDLQDSMAVYLGISFSDVSFAMSEAVDESVNLEWTITTESQSIVDQIQTSTFGSAFSAFLSTDYPGISLALSNPVTYSVSYGMSGPYNFASLSTMENDLQESLAVYLGIATSDVSFTMSEDVDGTVNLDWVVTTDSQSTIDQLQASTFGSDFSAFLTTDYPDIASAISNTPTYSVTYGMSGFYDFSSLSSMETDLQESLAVYLGIPTSDVAFSMSEAVDGSVSLDWIVTTDSQSIMDQLQTPTFGSEFSAFLSTDYPDISSAISNTPTFVATYGFSGLYDVDVLTNMQSGLQVSMATFLAIPTSDVTFELSQDTDGTANLLWTVIAYESTVETMQSPTFATQYSSFLASSYPEIDAALETLVTTAADGTESPEETTNASQTTESGPEMTDSPTEILGVPCNEYTDCDYTGREFCNLGLNGGTGNCMSCDLVDTSPSILEECLNYGGFQSWQAIASCRVICEGAELLSREITQADDRYQGYEDQVYTVLEGNLCTNCCDTPAFEIFCENVTTEHPDCEETFCGDDSRCYTRTINEGGQCTFSAADENNEIRTVPGKCIDGNCVYADSPQCPDGSASVTRNFAECRHREVIVTKEFQDTTCPAGSDGFCDRFGDQWTQVVCWSSSAKSDTRFSTQYHDPNELTPEEPERGRCIVGEDPTCVLNGAGYYAYRDMEITYSIGSTDTEYISLMSVPIQTKPFAPYLVCPPGELCVGTLDCQMQGVLPCGGEFSTCEVGTTTPEPEPSTHGDPIVWTFDGECYDLSKDGLYLASTHPDYNHEVKIAVYNDYMREIQVVDKRGVIRLSINNLGEVWNNNFKFWFHQSVKKCPPAMPDCPYEYIEFMFDAQDFRYTVQTMRHNYLDPGLLQGELGYHLDIYPRPYTAFYGKRGQYDGLYFENPLPEELPTCEERR